MKKKIFKYFSCMITVAILATTLLLSWVNYGMFKNRVMDDLRTYGRVFSRILPDDEGTQEEDALAQLTQEGLRVTLIHPDGTVYYDNFADPATMENHADRPEIQQTMENGEGSDIRNSSTIDQSSFYYAVRLEDGDILRLAQEASSIWSVYMRSTPLILLLAAVAATEYWFFQLWRLDWHVPMFYGGDGIYWVGQVQRSYGELSGSLGWPFYEVAGRYDPNYDLIYDIFVWFVGLFTKDTGTVFNLYVLVIPFANALAGYAVFRMVGLRRWLSFAFGLTFGLTPYVQQRMAGHMMLAACEFVPFSVLLCLWCAEDEQFNRPGRGFFKNKRNWLALAMAWGIANNGAAYYPYFTCFFLCVTALCLILRDRRWRAGTSCVVTIAEIVAWMIPDFFPMVLGILNGQGSTLTNGVYRSPVGADIYSLRISSLLLSPNGFGLQKLANWMGRYFHVLATDEGPMYNENAYGYLGIVGIFGFLALLLMLLHSRDWKAGRTERPELEDRLWLLSRLNVMALLLATIAGFGGIIGIFVRFIRGYNRISPYIAFFALLAVGLALEKQLTRRTGRSRKALAAVAILLLGYGYWEQQGLFRPAYEEIQDKWYQDAAFMNEVEAAAGDGAMLFTLPYMKNFENGSLNNMWDYTLLRGPLHSKTLKFTYGAGYGTKNDLWYRETSELEPDAMVAELRTQGMTGIYLDLDGYPEDEQQSALAALTEAAGCGPEDVIHSGSGLLCYIPLGQE